MSDDDDIDGPRQCRWVDARICKSVGEGDAHMENLTIAVCL